MILKKMGNEYKLYAKDDSCVATTKESPHKRLSKQNCDEIFCNKPAIQNPLNEYIKARHTQEECIGFIDGFNKAMELNKDKLFTVEDIQNILESDEDLIYLTADEQGNVKFILDEEVLINSLQQPKEIEVEIVTHVDLAATPVDSRHPDAYLGTDTGIPFLDENGCLILKKK